MTSIFCLENRHNYSLPKIRMHHIWTIFDNNTHTCERSACKIDERTRRKTDFSRRFKMENVFSFRNSLGIPRTILQRYCPGTVQCKTPV